MHAPIDPEDIPGFYRAVSETLHTAQFKTEDIAWGGLVLRQGPPPMKKVPLFMDEKTLNSFKSRLGKNSFKSIIEYRPSEGLPKPSMLNILGQANAIIVSKMDVLGFNNHQYNTQRQAFIRIWGSEEQMGSKGLFETFVDKNENEEKKRLIEKCNQSASYIEKKLLPTLSATCIITSKAPQKSELAGAPV